MLNRRTITAWLYIATTSASGMIILLVAARYLDPEMAGTWFTIQAAASFIVLADFGMGYALMREVAYAKAHAADGKSSINLKHIVAVVKFTGISLFFASIFTAGIWVYFQGSPDSRPESNSLTLASLWLLYSPTALMNLATIPLRSLLEGNGLLHLEKASAIASHTTQTLLLLLAAIFFNSVSLMCLATFIAAALNIIIMLAMAHINRHKMIIGGSSDFTFKKLFVASNGFFAVNLGAVVTKFAAAPIIAISVGAAELAPIYFAMKIFSAVSNGVAVLVTTERAQLATLYAQGKKFEIITLYRKILIKTVLVSAILGLLMAAGFPAAVKSFASGSYQVEWWVLAILAVDFSLNNCSSVSAQLVNACNRNPFKISVLASGLVCVGSLYVLIPILGASAAAVSQLLCGVLTSYWYNNYQAKVTLTDLKYA